MIAEISVGGTKSERQAIVIYGLALLALPVFVWLIPSYFEARTYSRLTGADVTMWDAMWVDLRVQESIPGDQHVQ